MTKLEALLLKQDIRRKVLDIQQALDRLNLKEPDMAVSQDVATLITEFDTATNAIAARISKLMAASTTLSADDKTALQAEVDKLTALGQDPANPVPVAVSTTTMAPPASA